MAKTPDLISVLAKWHPYYAEQSDYRGFLVLTQTCDLARRDGQPPSSRYVTIAAIRPVEEAIRREARKHQIWWQEPNSVVSEKGKDALLLFTDRLLDNNEPGYFYLHEDVSLGLSGHNCAFLALSVALRTCHYDLCFRAKVAQLKEPFQAKLGWLTGNMYSRVGTEEWDDNYGVGKKREQSKDLVDDLFVFVPSERIEQARKDLTKAKKLDEYSPAEIFEAVCSKKIVPRTTQFAAAAKAAMDASNFIDRICGRLVGQIQNDAALAGELGEALKQAGDQMPEQAASVLVAAIRRALRRHLVDKSFEGREKIVDFIVNTIKTDPEVHGLIS